MVACRCDRICVLSFYEKVDIFLKPHIYCYKSICVAIFMEKKTFINRMADAANMPKDVVLGVPILTMIGQMEVSVENYRGILEYTDLLIRVQTKIGQIKIIGKSLQIDYYTNDEMKVTGHIDSIEYH